jgi:hypothetical protein
MPLWAWVLVVLAVVLAVMWVWDRRTTARRATLADPTAMARGVRSPEGNPEAHRAAMRPDRFDAGGGPMGW